MRVIPFAPLGGAVALLALLGNQHPASSGLLPLRSEVQSTVRVAQDSSGGSRYGTISKVSVSEKSELASALLSIRLRLYRRARRLEVVRGDVVVKSFPVSVGKPGFETPLGTFQVFQMERHPVFRNPFKKGDVRPGNSQNNPLGVAWIGFHWWREGDSVIAVGFHGTNKKELAPSHGCVRMHNRDVAQLYEMVEMGTVVEVLP